MSRIAAALAAAAVTAVASTPARADDVGVGLGIGTLGAGVQLVVALKEQWNFRTGFNGWNLTYDTKESGVDYTGKAKLANVPVVIDWFPRPGGIFRVSAGFYANQSKFDVDAKPSSGVFVIGNNTYSATQVSRVNASVKYQAVAPYIGVGFGNAVERGRNWSWNLDLGLMYAGKPETKYTATCGSSLTVAQCAALQNDAAIEASEFSSEFSRNWRWYPVAQFWVGKQF